MAVRELLNTVKARKLAYYGHTMTKQGSCLEKEIMQGTMPGVRRRERPRTAWMDNIKTWTGLSVKESIRMTEDRDKWKNTSMVWPTLGSRTAKEQNSGRVEQSVGCVCVCVCLPTCPGDNDNIPTSSKTPSDTSTTTGIDSFCPHVRMLY